MTNSATILRMDDRELAQDQALVGAVASVGDRRPADGRRGSDALHISVEHPQQGVTVLVLDGELDSSTRHHFDAVISDEVHRGLRIVVELGGLSFMGSAGMSALLEATELAKRADAALSLVVASDNRVVGRPLALTGLTEALPIVGDLAAALA